MRSKLFARSAVDKKVDAIVRNVENLADVQCRKQVVAANETHSAERYIVEEQTPGNKVGQIQNGVRERHEYQHFGYFVRVVTSVCPFAFHTFFHGAIFGALDRFIDVQQGSFFDQSGLISLDFGRLDLDLDRATIQHGLSLLFGSDQSENDQKVAHKNDEYGYKHGNNNVRNGNNEVGALELFLHIAVLDREGFVQEQFSRFEKKRDPNVGYGTNGCDQDDGDPSKQARFELGSLKQRKVDGDRSLYGKHYDYVGGQEAQKVAKVVDQRAGEIESVRDVDQAEQALFVDVRLSHVVDVGGRVAECVHVAVVPVQVNVYISSQRVFEEMLK